MLYNPKSKLNTLASTRRGRTSKHASKYTPTGHAIQPHSIVDDIKKIEQEFDFDFFEELIDFQKFVKKDLQMHRELKSCEREPKQRQIFSKTVVPH